MRSIRRRCGFTSGKDLLAPSRSDGNTRLYTDDDLERLEVILKLTRDLGVNLAGVEIILNMREKMEAMQRQMEGFHSQPESGAFRARRPPGRGESFTDARDSDAFLWPRRGQAAPLTFRLLP